MEVDGEGVPGNRLEFRRDGRTHRVTVVLGEGGTSPGSTWWEKPPLN
jgi:hypothetical protein